MHQQCEQFFFSDSIEKVHALIDQRYIFAKKNAMSPLHQKNQMEHFHWLPHWKPPYDFQIADPEIKN